MASGPDATAGSLHLQRLRPYKEVEGQPLVAPRWSFCLSYNLEIRKEAIRLCKEESDGIQSALLTILKNAEHRMKHWLQLVAIPNTPSSSSSQEMQTLKIWKRRAHALLVGVRKKSCCRWS